MGEEGAASDQQGLSGRSGFVLPATFKNIGMLAKGFMITKRERRPDDLIHIDQQSSAPQNPTITKTLLTVI